MATPAQLAANKANAQLSSGPTSQAGKSTSSLNALKSGLTGRTVLLPSDDVAVYEAHLASITAHYKPAGPVEEALVQSIADHQWRLDRVRELEFGLYAMGHIEFAPLFANEPESLRSSLIKTQIYLTYQRQLNNLALQENRLRRSFEKDVAALAELQEVRKRVRNQKLDSAARAYIQAVDEGTKADWSKEPFGFEFSMEEIESRAADIRPTLFDQYWAQARKDGKRAS